MSTPKDLRTKAYVLRRTNYGEADRILNLITPEGKISAIAKAVRKEKSKLAGSVEMFSLIDINIHQGKSEFGVITSAKMIRFYDKIVADLNKMELAGFVLKRISLMAEQSGNAEYFKIADQVLAAINGAIFDKTSRIASESASTDIALLNRRSLTFETILNPGFLPFARTSGRNNSRLSPSNKYVFSGSGTSSLDWNINTFSADKK